jgi:hypothetical protein
MNNTFETSDLSLAAFLKVKNFKLLKVSKESSGRFLFTFEDTGNAEELAIEFTNSEFASYDSALRALKKAANSRAK